MTKLMKLSVIALLTGALGLVGCGDDGGGGPGGSGGSGGSGATGGAGGAACETTCGVGNELPTDSSTASVPFTCNVMNLLDLTLEMNFAGVSTAAIVAGDNTYELTFQTIITAETATLIAQLGDSAPIIEANGTVTPIAGSTDMTTASIVLDGVPCDVCIESATAATITLPTIVNTWDLDDGTEQVLELTDVAVVIEALGIPLELSNAGDAPSCFWGAPPDNSATAPADAPSLTFPLPAL